MFTLELSTLPSEIIWSIVSLLSPADLFNFRLTCKQMRFYCDYPTNWKDIILEPSKSSNTISSNDPNENKVDLWNLSDLKNILEPHLSLIEKVQVWGVRDNIIRYLIVHCPKLQDLTILGWSTLSDHALRLPAPSNNNLLCLKRLCLMGQQKSTFTSLDATTFGNLIAKCPQLEELTVTSCHIHIQAEGLINTMEDSTHTKLRSLTVATKKNWSRHHLTRLFEMCTHLKFLALVPDFNLDIVPTNDVIPILEENEFILKKDIQHISEEEMQVANNVFIYTS